MHIKVDPRILYALDEHSVILRAIMLVVFEDFIVKTSAEEFQARFGRLGTECLAKYSA